MNRRHFLKSSAAVTAGFATLSPGRASSANGKIVFGIMGLGGRGTALADMFARRSDVEIAYVCDADGRRLPRAGEMVERHSGRRPKQVQDFRRILEDKNVHVLVNATPDHWHGLATVMACQAGKDVFVEKPMAHNVWEGRRVIEAARKYGRIVQVGMQSRSAPYIHEAVEYIQGGSLGRVLAVRVFNMMQHPLRNPGAVQPVPEGFDYDMWCGPAPLLPYNPSRYWLNHSEYSCGPIAGDAVHQLDLARLLIGDPAYPRTISCHGGTFHLKDGRDTPDTQFALFEFADDLTLLFEASLWSPSMKKIPISVRDSDSFPDWPFCSTRIELVGTDGFMWVGRHGGGWQAYDAEGKCVRSVYGRQADREHHDNFIECIRTRTAPNADAAQGHYSALLCHLANISCRTGNAKLRFNPATETFIDHPEADGLLRRQYRAPWTMPAEV